MARTSAVLGSVAAALLLAGCGAGASSPSAADATSAAAAHAVPVAAAPSTTLWQDPVSALSGDTLLTHTGRRTGGAEYSLAAHRATGALLVSFECQGAGKLAVTVGSVTYDWACTAAPGGSLNVDATQGTDRAVRVTAETGVTWALAVGWSPKAPPRQ